MSSDPSAIIYYGFPIDCPDEGSGGKCYHDMNSEWKTHAGPQEPLDKSNFRTPDWDAWRDNVREYEKTNRHVTIAWSGASDSESYYVSAEGIKHEVEWDEQKPLTGVDLGPQPEADRHIKEFCEMFGIEFKQPGWHLAALYF